MKNYAIVEISLQIVHFWKVGSIPIFFREFYFILSIGTQEKKAEEVFLVKIATKRTTLSKVISKRH